MKRLSNHSPATQLGSSRSRNWIRICLTPKSLLSLWAGFSFCFCGYFKLCQGLLARWLFNLYPVASLLISKLFRGERTWYRKQASAWERFLEELLAFHVEGGLGLGRGGTQKHTYNWGGQPWDPSVWLLPRGGSKWPCHQQRKAMNQGQSNI